MVYTTRLPNSMSPYDPYVVVCSGCYEISSFKSRPDISAAFICRACGLYQTLAPDFLVTLDHGLCDQTHGDLISVKTEPGQESCEFGLSDSDSAASTVIDVNSSGCVIDKKRKRENDENEDCYTFEFVDPNYGDQALFSPSYGDFAANLTFKAVKGEVACRDYPHPRHLCAEYPYDKTPRYVHCKMCYCYVCDEPAPCERWSDSSIHWKHCEATSEVAIWRELRHQTNRIKCGELDISSFEELVMGAATTTYA